MEDGALFRLFIFIIIFKRPSQLNMNLSASPQYTGDKDTEGGKKLLGCISELQKDEDVLFFFATLITK